MLFLLLNPSLSHATRLVLFLNLFYTQSLLSVPTSQKNIKMTLDTLPPELFLHLADFLTTGSLSALIRTQKSLANLLTPCLYREIIKDARSISRSILSRASSLDKPPQWLQCMSQWHSQAILDYFRGIPVHLIEPNDEHVSSLLHAAAQVGNIDLMEIFVKKGLKVNCYINSSMTPLSVALAHNQDKIASWLLKAGASAIFSHDYGDRVLELAMECSHTTLQLVLENIERYDGPCCDQGCDCSALKRAAFRANKVQPMKDEALYLAVTDYIDERSITLLLEYGADPTYTQVGESTLWLALISNSGAIDVLLDRNANPSRFNTLVRQGLNEADRMEWDWDLLERFLDAILEAGCDIDSIPMPVGHPTALNYFASRLHPKAVHYLLERGANVQEVTSEYTSVLHLTLFDHSVDPDSCELICNLIIDRINPDTFDHTLPSMYPFNGGNTLHLAVRKKSYPVVCQLLDVHINREAEDDDGKTALDIAKELGVDDIIQVLTDPELRWGGRCSDSEFYFRYDLLEDWV